jgi:hypothetical protein
MSPKLQSIVLIIAFALGAVGIGAGVAMAIAPNHFIKEDSGVKACKTIVDSMKKTDDIKSDGPMTEAKYHQIRKPFEESSHADIRVAGENIIDTIYQAQTQDDPQNLGGALILMGTLQGQWGQLQTACSKQGVDVPQLPTK